MNAYIEPLSGKYYGTKIIIDTGGTTPSELSIWEMGNHQPSTRQLEKWNMTFGEAKDDGMMCDSHYETELSYKIARIIQKALFQAEL